MKINWINYYTLYFGLQFSLLSHEDIENAILELIIYSRTRQIKNYRRNKKTNIS